MSEMTLRYFDARGRGEIIRMLLHYAGQKFTDHRVTHEEWGSLKPNTPLGTLPVFEIDGVQYAQNVAIATFLAEQYGLNGTNNMEALQIGVLMMTREDIIMEEGKYLFAENDAKKEEQGKKLSLEVYPKFLSQLAKVIQENKVQNKSNFTVGKKFSLADILIYEGTQNLVQNFPSIIHAYPEVKNIRNLVEKSDELGDYLKNRPEYPM